MKLYFLLYFYLLYLLFWQSSTVTEFTVFCFFTLVFRFIGFPMSHSIWEPFWFAWHLIYSQWGYQTNTISKSRNPNIHVSSIWIHLYKAFKKNIFLIRTYTCGGILEPAYDRVFGREIISWAAWASSPSSSGWRGSEGMLVTVISSTTNRWSDRENTCTSSSSLHERGQTICDWRWETQLSRKHHCTLTSSF